MKFLKVTSPAVLAIVGLTLLVHGTNSSTADRYLMPPQMLPGLAILYLCALLSAFLTAQKVSATHSIEKIRKMVILRIGKSERTNLRNMVLILTFLMIAFAMTRGSTPMYRVLVTNYTFSLLINIFISLLASIGLFGWLSALFISKQSKEKS